MQVGKQLQMFATPKEIAGFHSGDYYMKPMTDVEPDMREGFSSRRDSGGGDHADLDSYLGAMHDDAKGSGGIEVPVRVRQFTNGRTGEMSNELLNGHHRALLAMKTNRLLPVIHHAGYSGEPGSESAPDIIRQGQRDELLRDGVVKSRSGQK